MVEQLDGRKFLLLTYFFCNYFPKSFAHSIGVGEPSSAYDSVILSIYELDGTVVLNRNSDPPASQIMSRKCLLLGTPRIILL
jgi:hypothetical protein